MQAPGRASDRAFSPGLNSRSASRHGHYHHLRHHVACYLLLRQLLADSRFVDVRFEALAAPQKPFFVHRLHLLQRGRIADVLAHRVMHFADSRGSQTSQHDQDVQLRRAGK